jgi:hypothetical protein
MVFLGRYEEFVGVLYLSSSTVQFCIDTCHTDILARKVKEESPEELSLDASFPWKTCGPYLV